MACLNAGFFEMDCVAEGKVFHRREEYKKKRSGDNALSLAVKAAVGGVCGLFDSARPQQTGKDSLVFGGRVRRCRVCEELV